MNYRLFSVLVILCLSLSFRSWSTHIVGGEIYYTHLSNNAYEITLIVYRDCVNGIPKFDEPAYLSVFDSTNNRIKDLELFIVQIDTIPIEINDSCTELNNSVCYEVGTYKIIDTLPPMKGGYTLAYDRCCWNASVQNIYKSLETGITIVAKIPDSASAYENSSPRFNHRTPPFLCLNKPLEFDHSATDPDGDSLVYKLFTPFNSSRSTINSHKAPLPPPYFPLFYQSPYSLNNVMGGDPLTIDMVDGSLHAVPGQIGQFVFGVTVEEYRNGKYLSATSRSYQFNVEPCNYVTEARFQTPIETCGDSVITFQNQSHGASGFRWHFGDQNSTDTISDNFEPTHVYSSKGGYNIRLIAFSENGNECNDTTNGNVYIHTEPKGDFQFREETCLNYVRFTDLSEAAPNNELKKWSWRFGDGYESADQNPYHHFSLSDMPQTYLITLRVTDDNNCVDSVTKSYTGVNRLFEVEDIGATKTVLYPRLDSTRLYANGEHAVSYSWSPKNLVTNPQNSTTYAKPSETTKFTITIVDDRGCTAEKDVLVQVHEYMCGEHEIFVPNAFTPNGDGDNDYLRVRGEKVHFLEFNVYNRWGQQVYSSNNIEMLTRPSLGWDGSFKGSLQDPGVFVYYLKATCNDGFSFIKKGNVTLIR